MSAAMLAPFLRGIRPVPQTVPGLIEDEQPDIAVQTVLTEGAGR
ncbi:hypothetical protein [Nonomuraea turcica]|nr:hypothetical protein [Nonomuraea sp. G32]MDP4503712.1 hypothetical protein [Nonomuraea sp. G32]